MSTSLATKYRPETLDEVVGNETTVSSLQKMIERAEKAPHAILFTGPSGCGKTTLARIISKKLNVAAFDFREMNSADFRGIDFVREIIGQMHLCPMAGMNRAWLLDECHQLSKDAQHALLKALEDPPEHAYFLLATTDPDKLLPTIKTRCVCYEVSLLTSREIAELIAIVAVKEKTKIPADAVKQIVIAAEGSPRMALSLLEKIIGLDSEDMLKAVGDPERIKAQAIELCRALIAKKSWKEVSSILQRLDEDPEKVRRAVLGYAQAVLLKSGAGQGYIVLDSFRRPFYDNGKAGLVMACYEALS